MPQTSATDDSNTELVKKTLPRDVTKQLVRCGGSKEASDLWDGGQCLWPGCHEEIFTRESYNEHMDTTHKLTVSSLLDFQLAYDIRANLKKRLEENEKLMKDMASHLLKKMSEPTSSNISTSHVEVEDEGTMMGKLKGYVLGDLEGDEEEELQEEQKITEKVVENPLPVHSFRDDDSDNKLSGFGAGDSECEDTVQNAMVQVGECYQRWFENQGIPRLKKDYKAIKSIEWVKTSHEDHAYLYVTTEDARSLTKVKEVIGSMKDNVVVQHRGA